MFKYKVYGKYQEDESNQVVDPEALCLEEYCRKCNKDEQGYNLLYHLKLDK